MNMSVSIKNKLYTVAMVTLSLGMVLLTGCDVLGVGSIDPEALGDVAIVSGVPTQGSDETEVPAGVPSEDSDEAHEADGDRRHTQTESASPPSSTPYEHAWKAQ